MGDDLIGSATSAAMERQIRHIREINIHPDYDRDTMQNDVAILYVNIHNVTYLGRILEPSCIGEGAQEGGASYSRGSKMSSHYSITESKFSMSIKKIVNRALQTMVWA